VRTERTDITQVLNQMRAMREQAQQLSSQSITGLSAEKLKINGTDSGFGNLLNNALNGVNAVQQDANTLTRAYELGEPGVDLTRVMIASQKANISFQAALQVRNKLVTAYQDIMNMPI